MKSFWKGICILISMQFFLVLSQDAQPTDAGGDVKPMTEKAYAKMFKVRRKDSEELLNIIMNQNNYERRYKLVEAACEKLLKILNETKSIISSAQYDPMVDKFPSQDSRLIDAVTVTLENTCLFGEILLHVPDISYRVLESKQNTDPTMPKWKNLLNWCIKYSCYFNERIIDTKGQQLLWLMEQEINPSKRTPQYINPYKQSTEKESNKKEKKAKTVKKGPKLVARDEF